MNLPVLSDNEVKNLLNLVVNVLPERDINLLLAFENCDGLSPYELANTGLGSYTLVFNRCKTLQLLGILEVKTTCNNKNTRKFVYQLSNIGHCIISAMQAGKL